MFNPHTRKKARNGHRRRTKHRNAKRTTGKMLECIRRTRMQMKCTWWHDMRCMTKATTHGDKDPNPRNKYNLTPETTRVGVQIGKLHPGCYRHDAKWEQDLCISSTQTVLLDDPCATTYKQFGAICICHIGYVTICQTGKIDICWSSNIAICQPCNTAICQNMKLKITSTI